MSEPRAERKSEQKRFFLSAAQPTDQGEESVVLVVVIVGGFGGLFSDLPYTLKMGASRENFFSKWVHPEKTFFQNGCFQRKLFLEMDGSRENIS